MTEDVLCNQSLAAWNAVDGSLAEPAPALGSLSLVQRILLTTDGTVTGILEQYLDEAIEVVKLEQALAVSGADGSELGLSEPDLGWSSPSQVLTRRVILRGSRSGLNLVYAESAFRPDLLPPELLERLVSTATPIGALLRESRLETFREILRSGQEPAADCALMFELDRSDWLAFRTYRIFIGRQPAVVITEKFPVRGVLSRSA